MTKYETYTKFEDFVQQVRTCKSIGDIHYAPIQKLEWVEKALPNGSQKVLHLLGSIRLTAADNPDIPEKQRHLSYIEAILDEPIETAEAGKAAGEKMDAGVKAMFVRLQDKCPNCRLFEGSVEIK